MILRALFALYVAVNLILLSVGVLPTLAELWPTLHHQLEASTRQGSELASTILVAGHHSRGLRPFLFDYLMSGLNIGLGLLLVWRQPRHRVAVVLGLALVGTAQTFNWETHEVLGHLPTHPLTFAHFYLHAISGATYVHALLIFPDGRLIPARPGRIILALVYAAMGLAFVLTFPYLAFVERELSTMEVSEIARGIEEFLLATEYIYFVLFFGLLIPLLGTALQLHRYRTATPEQRRRTRLVVWALTLAFGLGLTFFLTLLGLKLGQTGLGLAHLHEVELIVYRVYPVFFSVIPLALFVAIFRHHLFDIDLILNRTLVYGGLTLSLLLVYFGLVVILQRVFVSLTGEQSDLAIAGSTLAIAALFQPSRRRIQAFIDRRFHRAKYDAVRTLQAFSAGLRDEVDLAELRSSLTAVVHETMEPAHLSLWLKEGGR